MNWNQNIYRSFLKYSVRSRCKKVQMKANSADEKATRIIRSGSSKKNINVNGVRHDFLIFF